MNNKVTLLPFVFAVLCAACGEQDKSPKQLPPAPAPAPARVVLEKAEPPPAPTSFNTLSASNIKTETTVLMLSQIARAKHPEYVAAVAKANLLSDEAIASFSLNYRQETDAFKREEIKQKFVATMRATLDKASEVKWVVLKHFDKRHAAIPQGEVFASTSEYGPRFWDNLQPYDLQKKVFLAKDCYDMEYLARAPLPSDGRGLWSYVTGKEMPKLCELKVEDLSLAKKMEAARASGNLGYLSLRYYLHIPPGDVIPDQAPSTTLLVEPVMLELDLADLTGARVDARFDEIKVSPLLTYRFARQPDGTWVGSSMPPSN